MGRKGWIAVAIAGGVLMLGPVLGILGTVIGLKRAFSAAAAADPATKSQMLAEGISEAMNATAFGIVVFPFGALAVGIALFKLLRKPARNQVT